MLATALLVSRYIARMIPVPDIKGHNGYCTAIGNDPVQLLREHVEQEPVELSGGVARAPRRDYAINEMAVIYWKQQKLAAVVVEKLPAKGSRSLLGKRPASAGSRNWPSMTSGTCAWPAKAPWLGGLIARGVAPGLGWLSDGAPAVCDLRACRLLDPCGTAASPAGAAQRGTPRCHVRDGIWTVVPGPQGLSPAAGHGPKTHSGSPL